MNKDIDYDNLSSKEKELVHKLYENGYISRVSYLELTEKIVHKKEIQIGNQMLKVKDK